MRLLSGGTSFQQREMFTLNNLELFSRLDKNTTSRQQKEQNRNLFNVRADKYSRVIEKHQLHRSFFVGNEISETITFLTLPKKEGKNKKIFFVMLLFAQMCMF